MYLKPSEIFFCQDSINNVFDKNCSYRYKPIGETLDALCEGRSSVTSIPTISVKRKDGKWYTADNRRLWVFHNLERLGKVDEIYVTETSYIPSSKFTTYNGGISVDVRGSPGGIWHRKASVRKPKPTPVIENTPRLYIENKENLGRNESILAAKDSTFKRQPFQILDQVRNEASVSTEQVEMEHSESDTDTTTITTTITSSGTERSEKHTFYVNRGFVPTSCNIDTAEVDFSDVKEDEKSSIDTLEEDSIHVDISSQDTIDDTNIHNTVPKDCYPAGKETLYDEENAKRNRVLNKNRTLLCILFIVVCLVILAVVILIVVLFA